MKRRPRNQAPRLYPHGRRSREAWRKVTWKKYDTYVVDGLDQVFDDPGEAKRVAERRNVFARRVSDGMVLNSYAPMSKEELPE